MDFYRDHGDCCKCHELERYSTRKVGQSLPPSRPLEGLGNVQKFIWDPEHWRFRAEEARTVADQMTHEEARTIMRRIAMDYDRLAKLGEVQLIHEAIGRKTLPNNRDL